MLLLIALSVRIFANRTYSQPSVVVRAPRLSSKLLIWMLLTVTGVASHKLVAADLSIPVVRAPVGGSVNVTVQYRGQGAAIAALEFDLEYDRSILTITAAAGSVTTSAGKSLTTSVLPNGRTRFVIAGFSRNVIPDGSVANLTIQVRAGSSVGAHKLDFSNALGADPVPQSVFIKLQSGNLIVVPRT
jgi:hypothetical protein